MCVRVAQHIPPTKRQSPALSVFVCFCFDRRHWTSGQLVIDNASSAAGYQTVRVSSSSLSWLVQRPVDRRRRDRHGTTMHRTHGLWDTAWFLRSTSEANLAMRPICIGGLNSEHAGRTKHRDTDSRERMQMWNADTVTVSRSWWKGWKLQTLKKWNIPVFFFNGLYGDQVKVPMRGLGWQRDGRTNPNKVGPWETEDEGGITGIPSGSCFTKNDTNRMVHNQLFGKKQLKSALWMYLATLSAVDH